MKAIPGTFAIIFAAALCLFSNKVLGKDKGFIKNKGQIVDQCGKTANEVLYLHSSSNFNIQLRTNGFSYELKKRNNKGEILVNRIDFDFINASNFKVEELSPVESATNYNLNNKIISTKGFNEIIYKNVYTGIDLVFVLENNKFKYNIIAQSGADISDIKLKVNGCKKIAVRDTTLFLKTKNFELTESIPESFLVNETTLNQKIHIPYELKKDNTLTFKYHNKVNQKLVIDPMPYLTYLGDTADELTYCNAIDTLGNYYVAGSSNSAGNIATVGAFQALYSGNTDALVIKFNHQGQRIWSTYFGGSQTDFFTEMTYSKGKIVCVGNTNSTAGLVFGNSVHDSTFNGGSNDAFITAFDLNGQVIWSSYFGGSSHENPYFPTPLKMGITGDTLGNLIVCGTTASNSGIAFGSVNQGFYGGGYTDAFLAKFNSSGQIIWSTYIGGALTCSSGGIEFGYNVATDNNNNIYITGSTSSQYGIATNGAYSFYLNPFCMTCPYAGSCGTPQLGFIQKFSPDGNTLWGTYLNNTNPYAIACDSLANIYVGMGFRGVISFNTLGHFRWKHELNVSINDLTLAPDGSVFAVGSTTDNNLATFGSFQNNYRGIRDGVIAKFNNNGTLLWNSYIGGDSIDQLSGVAISPQQRLFFNGSTKSLNLTGSSSWQVTQNGMYDALIGYLDDSIQSINLTQITSPDQLICPGQTTDTIFTQIVGNVSGRPNIHWVYSNDIINENFKQFVPNKTEDSLVLRNVTKPIWLKKVINGQGFSDTSQAIFINLKNKPFSRISHLTDTIQCFYQNNFILNDSSQWNNLSVLKRWEIGYSRDTSTLQNLNLSFNTPGTFPVKLLLTANNGCTDSAVTYLFVTDTFTNTILSGSETICTGKPINMIVGTEYSGGFNRLFEDFNDVNLSSRGWNVSLSNFYWLNTSLSSNSPLNSFNRPGPGGAFTIFGHSSMETPYFAPTDSNDVFSFDAAHITQNRPQEGRLDSVFVYAFVNNQYIFLGEFSGLFHGPSNGYYAPPRHYWSTGSITLPKGTVRLLINFHYNFTYFQHWFDHFRIEKSANTLQWVQSTNGPNGPFTPAIGNNKGTNYSPSGLTQNTWYRRVLSGSSCGIDTSQAVLKQVITSPVARISNEVLNICAGNSFSFIDSSSNAASKVWKFGSSQSNIFLGDTLNYTFNKSGRDTIRLVVQNGICFDSIQNITNVFSIPNASFTTNKVTDLSSNNSFNFQSNSFVAAPSAIQSTNWYLSDSTYYSGVSVMNKTFNQPNIYKVSLVVTADLNCADTIHRFVEVFNKLEQTVQDTFKQIIYPTMNDSLVADISSKGFAKLSEEFTFNQGSGNDTLPPGWQSRSTNLLNGQTNSYLRSGVSGGILTNLNVNTGKHELFSKPFSSFTNNKLTFDIAAVSQIDSLNQIIKDTLWIFSLNNFNEQLIKTYVTNHVVDTLTGGITTALPVAANLPLNNLNWCTITLNLPAGCNGIKIVFTKNKIGTIFIDRLHTDTLISFNYRWISSALPLTGFSNATGTFNKKNYQLPLITQGTYYRRIATNFISSDTSRYVLVEPIFNQPVYFNKANQDISLLSNWGINHDGTGTNPSSFAINNAVFHIKNGNNITNSSVINISGQNAKLLLGDALNTINLYNDLSASISVDTFKLFSKASFYNYGNLNTNFVQADDVSFVSYTAGQQIQNIAPGNYATLNASNSNKILLGNIHIRNTLLLSSNISGNNKLISVGNRINPGALFHNSGSIQAKLKLAYNSTSTGNQLSFPLGNNLNKNRHLYLTPNQNQTGYITASFIDTFINTSINIIDTSVQPNINLNRLNREGYWLIEFDSANILNCNIRARVENQTGLSNINPLRLIHFTNKFSLLHTYSATTGSTNSFDIIYNNSQLVNGKIFLASDSSINVLPAKLLSFSGKYLTNNKTLLNWTATNEINLNSYTVQRSNNGVTFDDLEDIKPSFKTISNYTYHDVLSLNDKIYYRLRINNSDRFPEYSPIIFLNQNNDNTLVYPNPFSEKLVFYCNNKTNHKLSIFDSSGRLIWTGEFNTFTFELNTDFLAKGFYSVRLDENIYKLVKN